MTPERTLKATVEREGMWTCAQVPSDDESPFVLTMDFAHTDLSLRLFDPTFSTNAFLVGLRFTGAFGGGSLPMIPEELSAAADALERKAETLNTTFPTEIDSVPDFLVVEIKTSQSPNEPKLAVRNLPDDADVEPVGFVDIEVLQNGDVVLTQRNARHPGKASMLFRTKENGGKYPAINQALKKIAQRIATAAEA